MDTHYVIDTLVDKYSGESMYSNGECGNWTLAASIILDALEIPNRWMIAFDGWLDNPQHAYLYLPHLGLDFDHHFIGNMFHNLLDTWGIDDKTELILEDRNDYQDFYMEAINFVWFDKDTIIKLAIEMGQLFSLNYDDMDMLFLDEVFQE